MERVKPMILARWRIHTTIQINGVLYHRAPGDEDLMSPGLAAARMATGRIELVGNEEDIPVASESQDEEDDDVDYYAG